MDMKIKVLIAAVILLAVLTSSVGPFYLFTARSVEAKPEATIVPTLVDLNGSCNLKSTWTVSGDALDHHDGRLVVVLFTHPQDEPTLAHAFEIISQGDLPVFFERTWGTPPQASGKTYKAAATLFRTRGRDGALNGKDIVSAVSGNIGPCP